MKAVIHINIASQAFVLDNDAYELLRSYLDDISDRLPDDEKETLDDIECGIAEILIERRTNSMSVIDINHIKSAIERMGPPDEFGSVRNSRKQQFENFCRQTQNTVYRTLNDRYIAGVCGGLAKYFRLDPTLVRVGMALISFFGGLSIWLYIILWIVLPLEKRGLN